MDWLIPACAGKTRSAGPFQDGSRGSSPRVRGKLPRGRPEIHHDGLIPACAGKTSRCRQRRNAWRAHPRVCGENAPRHAYAVIVPGSSPRVRGKPSHADRRQLIGRLIPACAGKTGHPETRGTDTPAHPRVCGENEHDGLRVKREDGSSPRVRGKPVPSRLTVHEPGLIPACAGKTYSCI